LPVQKKLIRISVVEDNRLLREGLISIIKEQADLKLVAALGTSENVLERIRAIKPNVLLLDLGLRAQNSLRVVRDVKNTTPETKVIVMDLVPSQSDIFEFVREGVSGFLLKDASIDDFLRTIRSVAHGAKVLPPHLTESLFTQIVAHAVNGSSPSRLIESVRMTKRERQVIELVSDGLTNKEIAQRLHLSTYTVKSHVHNILEKLALHTRVQIAGYAHTMVGYRDVAANISLIDE
jgi:two-component system response regulator DegU